MFSQQADGCSVFRRRSSVAGRLQSLDVRIFHAHEESDDSGVFVKMQEVSISCAVVGSCRSNDDERRIFFDHGFAKINSPLSR